MGRLVDSSEDGLLLREDDPDPHSLARFVAHTRCPDQDSDHRDVEEEDEQAQAQQTDDDH